ncbi:hypothetical protein GOV07_01595 [Candidatus Woesearchaeota archaeon]|nr:hypothetical protein [Candidatus Woesearchaeota archaeon]
MSWYTEITFTVPRDITGEFKAQLEAMAMAKKIGSPINAWLMLLIIPVLVVVVIFFQRFKKEPELPSSDEEVKI